jgi:cellobiose phosphorylase
MSNNNGYEKYGQFSPCGKEFIVSRMDTPRPWINYAWSEHLMAAIDQRGSGQGIYRDADGNRSVAFQERFVYLKDIESGEFWTIGWNQVRSPLAVYQCRHGLGYSVLSCRHLDWEAEWTITATPDSFEVWQINIKNRGARSRKISVYPGVAFALGGWEPYGTLENYACAEAFSPRAVYAVNRSNERPQARNNGFFAASLPADAQECSVQEFLGGYYESWSAPKGIAEPKLGNHAAMNEQLAGIMQYDVELEANDSWTVYCGGGSCFDSSEIGDFGKETFDHAMTVALSRTECFKRLDFTLPEQDWECFFNIWGKQQLLLLKDFARVFLIGFRDTLQDATAIAAYEPELAGKSIIRTLGYQYRDGSALRGWSPIDLHKYADSGVWIAMAAEEYLRETGDVPFFDLKQKFYDAADGTVWEHIEKSLEWLMANLGEHGLPKLYFGDWNDSLNIGRKGRGESVWLAMALVVALESAAKIGGQIGKKTDFHKMAAAMREQIEAQAWNGTWYLRGFDDDGRPVGDGDRIFSEPQSWAVMARLNPERLQQAMRSVDERLRTGNGLVVCNPPYHEYDPACGRISCMLPGWGENGSCYCHVTAFQAVADAMMRDGGRAVDSLRSILPFHAGLPVEISKLEPYAFSNMFRGPANARSGETFKGWTSGTVPWAMRALTHYILGVRPDYEAMVIDPVLPAEWNQIAVKRIFRGFELDIKLENPRKWSAAESRPQILLNGKELAENRIELTELRNGTNTILCKMEKYENDMRHHDLAADPASGGGRGQGR